MWGQMCRASAVPFLLPALLNGWHGYPPHRMSTGSTSSHSTAVMSPRFGTWGWWWARMRAAPGSLSATHASDPPNTSCTAMSRPP